MTVIVVAVIIFGLLFLALASSKQQKIEDEQYKKRIDEIANRIAEKRNSTTIEVKVKSGDADGCFFCSIAGVKYQCGNDDIGGFLGYVKPEPTNEYDNDACAVYRNDHKKLGYIPKNELSAYREWSELKEMPCIGFIKQGDNALFGKVKIIDGTESEYSTLAVIKFVRWMIANLGLKYKPTGFDVNIPLKTKKDWLGHLDGEIARMENELLE